MQIIEILKNNGATLDREGKEVHFSNGYQVAFTGGIVCELKNLRKIVDSVNCTLTKCKRAEFVGVWVDAGRVYIDISIHIQEKQQALKIGKENEQLTIYDWANNTCPACQ